MKKVIVVGTPNDVGKKSLIELCKENNLEVVHVIEEERGITIEPSLLKITDLKKDYLNPFIHKSNYHK